MGFWQKDRYKQFYYGVSDPVFTPNLDKLAEESIVLSNATSTFPLCSPYRGMMLLGMMPHKNEVVLNCNSARPCSGLKEDVDCISDFPTKNILITGGYAEKPRPDGLIWYEQLVTFFIHRTLGNNDSKVLYISFM